MGGGSQLSATLGANAQHRASELNTQGLVSLRSIMGAMGKRFGDGDWGKIPGEVSQGYDKIRANTEESFRSANFGAQEANSYLARTQGGNISGGEINEAQRSDALALDVRRRQALGQINLEEANAGMSANNGFMRLMSGAGQTAVGLANTHAGLGTSAASMMGGQDPWMGAMSGAATGASMGSAIPGWGTAVGAVAGGLAGYFGSR